MVSNWTWAAQEWRPPLVKGNLVCRTPLVDGSSCPKLLFSRSRPQSWGWKKETLQHFLNCRIFLPRTGLLRVYRKSWAKWCLSCVIVIISHLPFILCYSSFVLEWWWWWLFPRLRGFGENLRPFIPRMRFWFVCFLKWRLAGAHQFHSLCQDQSTVPQRAEMTVAKRSLTSCKQAHFQIGSHTMSRQRHSQPTLTSLGQGCMLV